MFDLLTRDEFRKQVFNRDNNKCVICSEPAVDAHHIIERRLWPDSGYYLNNGASVCSAHHFLCETTEISVEEIREACGIMKKIIPPHMYDDQIYDKWGNIILENGKRLKGDLFDDESVQKVLKIGGFLPSFTHYIKYPRTHHLLWSPGMHDDDRLIESLDGFIDKRVIVTEKMDGENTTLYNDYIHARSLDSQNHESRNWVKNFWAQMCDGIPSGWRVCGENLFATHSIRYEKLPSYFLGFSIWDEHNRCLEWDNTIEWFNLLGITAVPVLYDGIWDEHNIQMIWNKIRDPFNCDEQEGYVVRVADSFLMKDFRHKVAKYVRENHVQTVKHWMHGKKMERNLLWNSQS